MLDVLLEPLAEIVAELILRPVLTLAGWLLWLLLFPGIWMLCAPFILFRGIFYGPAFRGAVTGMFRAVHKFWSRQRFWERSF